MKRCFDPLCFGKYGNGARRRYHSFAAGRFHRRITAHYANAPCGEHLHSGAGNGARTRHLRLGKAALYQMSYSREWCLRVDLNHRHRDFQSLALPTELPRQMAIRKGLEPSTSSVTGWHSNQLNYRTNGGNNRARTYDPLLVRQMLSQLSYAPTWPPHLGGFAIIIHYVFVVKYF